MPDHSLKRNASGRPHPAPLLMAASRIKPSAFGAAMLVLHTLALGGIAWQRHEGSWGGFLVYVLDLPVSLLYFPMASSQSQQWAASAILGGAWWCVIGVLLGRVAVWAVSAIQHAAKP